MMTMIINFSILRGTIKYQMIKIYFVALNLNYVTKTKKTGILFFLLIFWINDLRCILCTSAQIVAIWKNTIPTFITKMNIFSIPYRNYINLFNFDVYAIRNINY